MYLLLQLTLGILDHSIGSCGGSYTTCWLRVSGFPLQAAYEALASRTIKHGSASSRQLTQEEVNQPSQTGEWCSAIWQFLAVRSMRQTTSLFDVSTLQHDPRKWFATSICPVRSARAVEAWSTKVWDRCALSAACNASPSALRDHRHGHVVAACHNRNLGS